METVSVIAYRTRSAGPASDIDLFYLQAPARAGNQCEGFCGEWNTGFARRDSQFGGFMDGFTEADAGWLDDLHHSADGVPRILARFSTLTSLFDESRIVAPPP